MTFSPRRFLEWGLLAFVGFLIGYVADKSGMVQGGSATGAATIKARGGK